MTRASNLQLFGRWFDCSAAVGKLFSLMYRQAVGLLFIMGVKTGKINSRL